MTGKGENHGESRGRPGGCLPQSGEWVLQKTFRRVMHCNRQDFTPAMAAFLSRPDPVLEGLHEELLKNGRGSTVAKIEIDERKLVVKRYNIKGLWHGLRRSLRVTRAAHSWRNAHRLLMLGISTPRPVALVEKRFGPFRRQAYFINEYLEGPRAVDYFEGRDLQGKETVARRMAEIIKKLRTARISHGDMKATNFIIHNDQPALVDLDAMRFHGASRRFACRHQKDRDRFFKNWKDTPEVYDLFQRLLA